ncbi:hypothetical protein ACFWBF_07370 [Streptomyces sp. NPDC060028]|uniref:hypothetical protein n=1 Tax=Streptomyces sp. NPDC060028 TaxID=3347041 RepID=UPI00368A94B0
MSTVRRRTLVRAAAVTACAAGLLALPTAAALAEGVPAASTASQRTLVKTLALADGVSRADVYRTAKDAYQADVLTAEGAKAATVNSRDGSTGYGDAGDLHLALRSDGVLSSWVGDTVPVGSAGNHVVTHKTGTRDGKVTAASAPAPAHGSASASASTSGSVSGSASAAVAGGTVEALRLNTLADGPGSGLMLLAAGAGVTAIGAAGLGFAMLRRGRTDG